jgi:serine/threonine protein kinase
MNKMKDTFQREKTQLLIFTGIFLAEFHDCDISGYEIKSTRLEELETRLEGEEKERFLDLIRSMIQWRPEDRKSAGELLKHPWFDGVRPHSGCRLDPD